MESEIISFSLPLSLSLFLSLSLSLLLLSLHATHLRDGGHAVQLLARAGVRFKTGLLRDIVPWETNGPLRSLL